MASDANRSRPHPQQVAAAIHRARYAHASVTLLAGSVARGEGTAFSDLDLVVLFDRLEHPYRDSFYWNAWPVEVFVHDPQTLEYFFTEVDRPKGNCSLAAMVVEGVELPAPCPLSQAMKVRAQAVIDAGPPRLSAEEVCMRRYFVTELIDDLRSPRSTRELIATGARLYETLADCAMRLAGCWSAQGKALVRQLSVFDDALAARHTRAFMALFRDSDPQLAITLAEDILRPFGGWLFAGHRLDAPASWRK